jgi:ABC-type glycerol-3-phosphate transport system substrate-binding protein
MPKARPRLAILLLPCIAAGCHLVDQRDFDASAGRPPVPLHVATPPPAQTHALVTIRYATPNPQYREAVANAVQRALARKPDVLFTVTTLVPAQPGTDVQADQAALAAGSGREVAQAIVDAGAAAGQVEQVVRLQPGLPVREVQVTVH